MHPARVTALVETAIAIGVIVVGVSVALRLAIAVLRRTVRPDDPRRAPQTRTLVPLLESTLRYLFYFAGAVMVLDRLHFNVAALIASAGIAGIAIGFGAQHFIRDIIAGFFLLFEGLMQVGDAVRIGDVAGEVERINLRTTQIRQLTGELVTIPNGEIQRLANMNRGFMRALVIVSLPYGAPLARALEVMQRTAEAWATEHPEIVLASPEVHGIVEFGAADLRVRMVVTVRPGTHLSAERELRRRLLEAFDAEGIPLVGPQAVLLPGTLPGMPQGRPGTPSGASPSAPPVAGRHSTPK